ncbi:MAG TPA: LytTR family DNA-binding domain-containing protein [Chitinophagaceae bacterium]|nr:LytTR family DNA-binding domain-containing protein [Chitinophagaceae bacterium]
MDNQLKILRCLVMDDEPLARGVICRYIKRLPVLQLAAECSNALEAMAVLKQQPVDVIFADIQMPELLGTDFIRLLHQPPTIIITTAFTEYAMQGYELDVVDYLLKPVQFERFLKAVNKVLRNAGIHIQEQPLLQDSKNSRTEPYLYFRTDRKMVKVMLDDILYVEGMKNYIKIFTVPGVVITKTSMNAIEAMLPAELFIRVHRSYIVSKHKIKSVTGDTVELNNIEIPIGKLFKNNVAKLLPPGHVT